MAYKWCVVPHCTNTSISTPEKMFVSIPKNNNIRKKWLMLARRDPKDIAASTNAFMCEDHFDKPSPAPAPVSRDESSSSDVEVPRTTDKDADGRSHEDVCCECGADVEGFRYVCVQCSVSLCGACAARGAHPAHYVLRLPHRATQEQTDAVLSLLRGQLGEARDDDASMKFEIKEEPLDPLTDAPSMEDDNPASQDFDIVVKEEPLQEPMDEAAELQAAKENEAFAESEYPSVESSFSVHTHSTKPNEPLIKDSAPQQLTTFEVLEPIGSQYEIEIRNEPNQVCVPGTSSQQRSQSYATFFFSKNPTKRTVPNENIFSNKISKTSASVNKGRKKPIVQILVKKK